MRTHTLLCLQLFSHEKGGIRINPQSALARIEWAIRKVEDAICDPRSQESRQLANLGYASLILNGPHGQDGVVCFDKGNKVRIGDDGRSLVEEGRMGVENAFDMLAWLRQAHDYALWIALVHAARDTQNRPPVLELEHVGEYDYRLVQWLGCEAAAYIEYWKQAHRIEVASRAAAATVPAPSGYGSYHTDDIPDFLPNEMP